MPVVGPEVLVTCYVTRPGRSRYASPYASPHCPCSTTRPARYDECGLRLSWEIRRIAGRAGRAWSRGNNLNQRQSPQVCALRTTAIIRHVLPFFAIGGLESGVEARAQEGTREGRSTTRTTTPFHAGAVDGIREKKGGVWVRISLLECESLLLAVRSLSLSISLGFSQV